MYITSSAEAELTMNMPRQPRRSNAHQKSNDASR